MAAVNSNLKKGNYVFPGYFLALINYVMLFNKIEQILATNERIPDQVQYCFYETIKNKL